MSDHPLHEGHEVCEEEERRRQEREPVFGEDDPRVQHEAVYSDNPSTWSG